MADGTVKDSAGQERPIKLGPKLWVSFFRCRFLSDELVLLNIQDNVQRFVFTQPPLDELSIIVEFTDLNSARKGP